MKQVELSELTQTFSHLSVTRPESFWGIDLKEPYVESGILDRATESTDKWTGWGFKISGNEVKALLLFEDKEDAMFMQLSLGEEYEIN